MTPEDPNAERLDHGATTIPGQDPGAKAPGLDDPGFRNQTRPIPLNPDGGRALLSPNPSFAGSNSSRREIPVCCWVAVVSSLTSVVLAAMLWLRPPAPAAPAQVPQANAPVATPAPAAKAAPAPGSPAAFQAALQPYLEAAKAGDINAMRMLGTMYYHGLDLPRNREEGLKWYRKAAESGSKVAKEELKQLE